MPKIEITHPAPDGEGTSLVVDGVEMKHRIAMGADLHLGGPLDTSLTVKILSRSGFRADIDGKIVLDDETHALLLAAGWTAPADAEVVSA